MKARNSIRKKQGICKCLLLSFLMISAIDFSTAQETSQLKNQIKFSPIRVFNLFNPGLELSYERVHGNFSTQLSTAYLTDYWPSKYYENYNGYRALIEEKWFITSKHRKFPYLSVELGYYAAQMKASSWFISKDFNDDLGYTKGYRDTFNLNRKGLMIDTKFGIQFTFNHFVVDISVGAGVITHDIRHSGRKNSNDETEPPIDIEIRDMFEKEGKRTSPNFPMSVKIGYMF